MNIKKESEELYEYVKEIRRDFHKYAESGWTEFRTASIIAKELNDLGYKVKLGREVIKSKDRMGVPSEEKLEKEYKRALKQGAIEEYANKLRGGYTGVIGEIGNEKGPTIALRFDIDALGVLEDKSMLHRPRKENFASVNEGVMHSCGHDGHAAVGLGIAKILSKHKDKINGTIKLIFQPAEEGVRGAKSMVSKGVLNNVDYLIGHHLYSSWEIGVVGIGMYGYLATTKLNVEIEGEPAHAGGSPEKGKNAMLAASTAVLNLNAIARHKSGKTRINVGRLIAGTGRNVICPNAYMEIETRGETTELNDYMRNRATRIINSAAEMYECKVSVELAGEAESAKSDVEFSNKIEKITKKEFPKLKSFVMSNPVGGSEDFTYMMKYVQKNGGKAVNIGIGADIGGFGHHTKQFDIDEKGITIAMMVILNTVFDIIKGA